MGLSIMKLLVKEGEDWEHFTANEFDKKRNWLSNNIHRNLKIIGTIDVNRYDINIDYKKLKNKDMKYMIKLYEKTEEVLIQIKKKRDDEYLKQESYRKINESDKKTQKQVYNTFNNNDQINNYIKKSCNEHFKNDLDSILNERLNIGKNLSNRLHEVLNDPDFDIKINYNKAMSMYKDSYNEYKKWEDKYHKILLDNCDKYANNNYEQNKFKTILKRDSENTENMFKRIKDNIDKIATDINNERNKAREKHKKDVKSNKEEADKNMDLVKLNKIIEFLDTKCPKNDFTKKIKEYTNIITFFDKNYTIDRVDKYVKNNIKDDIKPRNFIRKFMLIYSPDKLTSTIGEMEVCLDKEDLKFLNEKTQEITKVVYEYNTILNERKNME